MSSDLSRRRLLQGAVALSLSGCTPAVRSPSAAPSESAAGSPTLPPTPDGARSVAPTTAARAPGPTRADWRALARTLDGDVVRRFDSDFDDVRVLFNPRFDRADPLAVVEAASADDVAEAIGFAQRFGLLTRPRAGGHSYVGASTGGDALMVDVRRMHRVSYDAGSRVATVGGGAGLFPVHVALARHGRSIPTGTCPTVGAAGLTLGGGLGVDNRRHGLTSDALVGLTMVTADGRTRVVNAEQNRDLFWASRGGGGGNFGIVTSLRYQTHAAQPMGFFLLSFPWGRAPAVLRGWARRVRTMPRSVWANLHLDASPGSTSVRIVGVCEAGDEDEQAAAMQREIGVGATSESTFRRSFLDGVRFLGGGSTSARTSFAAGSDVLSGMPDGLAHTLPRIVARRAAHGGSAAVILDPLTGAVSDKRVDATAFPWRRHLATVQWYVGLPLHPAPATVRAAQSWIGSAHRAIGGRSVGAYVNYLEPGRPLAAYYGRPHLARLRRIKAEVDPDGFFSSAYTV